ncbi:putative lysine-specific demethylase JMJ16 [Hibiscus syriacus]|uniref:Lysine-specific demethylase JMJ16 n=1 Tax=Hibiscus syriacus TaxID=106335 RepID=A0A6A3AX82_HIBSY|nr:putative lysine-specific demethylase JMJ16 [Hibiscus syriacus]
MVAEHCQTPIENDNSARISAPPGFASLSAFFLKKVNDSDEKLNFEASKDSTTQDKVQAEAIDTKKSKKSVQNRPWILNEKIDHIANEYLSVQPYKGTRRLCPGDAKGVVLEEVPVFRPSEEFEKFPDHSEKDEEPGPEFTLKRFKKHADDFTLYYFTSKYTGVGKHGNCKQGDPSVESIECEYRKIVENPTGRLEVLYVDLDTATFGSGFPIVSKPGESCDPSYIQSGWNINNVPTLPGSLLSFESDKTSGVLTPRLHVGMCFHHFLGFFKQKVEEHYLNSICYMHVGSPKIWYSVPGRYSFKFETLMKKYFPDFLSKQFKQCEGVKTRLSPFVLKSEGVPVYRCIQYPREFVLVFPGAYHSTFDCGFNVAETVNFAPLDWLPHGQNAVALYQSQGRETSMSFDKLLIGAAREAVKAQWELSLLKNNTIDNLRWKGYCGKNGILAETLKSRVKQEGMRREHLCGSFQTKRKDKNFSSTGKKECSICYFDLFLSAVHCPCSADRYSCLNHAKRLCSCTWIEKIFLYQYEIGELNILVEAVEGKFSAVYTWAKEDLNLGLRNYTPKENSFTEDKGQKEQKLQDAGTSNGNGWTAVASIKAEIKARIQRSQCPNGQKSKDTAVSTPPLPNITQDNTSLLFTEVMPKALSSSSSVSSSSESDDTLDLDLIDGEGCVLSTLNSRLSPSQHAREITLSSQRRTRDSEVTSSKLRRPPKREGRLSELLKDKHGTGEHLKSTSEKLPKSHPVSKRRKKK